MKNFIKRIIAFQLIIVFLSLTGCVKNEKPKCEWSEWTIVLEATCTTPGFEERQCIIHGEHESNRIEALGHDLQHHEGLEPTCIEKGHNAYDTCSSCDYTTYQEKKTLGHDLQHHEGLEPT